MTFRSLAFSNALSNWRAYAAFFLSSVFSVMIFYLYASFVMHPDVVNGHIVGANSVVGLMKACEYLIIIFSFFFILYSSSAFLKTRKKEFGLLSLFGTTRIQLRKMVIYESMAIGTSAILAGLALGVLLSKLFIRVIGVLLGEAEPIRFAVPLQAVLLTAMGFLLLFLLISLMTAFRVGRSQIIELLGDARRPKKAPAASPLLSILAVVSLAAAYLLASILQPMGVVLLSLPIIGLTTLGTYFLYTQLSVAILALLNRLSRVYYNRTNMLTISQMGYRIKDNARILFVVTILAAVVMSAASTVYVIQKTQRENLLVVTPFTVGYVEKGEGHPIMDPADVKQLLQSGGGEIAEQLEVKGLYAQSIVASAVKFTKEKPGRAMVISNTDYNQLAKRKSLVPVHLNDGETMIVNYSLKGQGAVEKTSLGKSISGNLGASSFKLKLVKTSSVPVLSPIQEAKYLLVVPDKQMADWSGAIPSLDRLTAYGFELKNWEKALPAEQKLEQALTADQKNKIESNRIAIYTNVKQTMGLTLFIGIFISILFFIAAGSLLYFKQFTELQDDQRQFQALRKIGLTDGELRRTVAVQIGTLYLIPCLIGIVHSLFAMIALGTIIGTPVWMYGLTVMGVYMLFQLIYFLVSCISYTKSIMKVSAV